MPYRFGTLAFEVPEGRDDSTLLIVDDRPEPAWNLVVRVDELAGGAAAFPAYVAAQVPPAGVVVDGRQELKVKDRPAVVFDQHLRVDGAVLRQQLAFIADGTRVVVVTMTAKEQARSAARASFDKLLATFAVAA